MWPFRKKEIVYQEFVNFGKIDPQICEKYLGKVDEHGNCMMRVEIDTRKPHEMKILEMRLVSPTLRTVAPPEPVTKA